MAEIVATGGGAVQIAPPPSVVLDVLVEDALSGFGDLTCQLE